jgi:hypothetical protein
MGDGGWGGGARNYLEKYRLKMHIRYVHGRDEQTHANKFYSLPHLL